MSQLERLKEEKRTAATKKRSVSRGEGRLVNWAPTNGDKEKLRSKGSESGGALDPLTTALKDGHRLSLGYSVDRDGCFAILRQGDVDWKDAVSVSVWSSGIVRSLLLLAYYLEEVNPEFPDGVQPPLFSDDW